MPTICIFDGIKIMMFYREHAPPHFHAEHGDEAAVIGIDPIMIIEGRLSDATEQKYLSGRRFIKLNSALIGNWRVAAYPYWILSR